MLIIYFCNSTHICWRYNKLMCIRITKVPISTYYMSSPPIPPILFSSLSLHFIYFVLMLLRPIPPQSVNKAYLDVDACHLHIYFFLHDLTSLFLLSQWITKLAFTKPSQKGSHNVDYIVTCTYIFSFVSMKFLLSRLFWELFTCITIFIHTVQVSSITTFISKSIK